MKFFFSLNDVILMKRIYKKILILLCLSLVLFLSPSSSYLNIFNKNSEYLSIKTGTSWNLFGNIIDIGKYHPSRGWYYYASTYPWCFGSGTENDPYVIENVTIHGTGVERLISIDDTQDFFIIRNCMLYEGEYGIYLDDASNGKLINNNITLNTALGIFSWIGDNISITDNSIQKNRDGIYMYGINNLTLSGNDITNNIEGGIFIDSIGNSQIINNNISANPDGGLWLNDPWRSTIKNNTVYNDGSDGIRIYSGSSNTIVNNTAKDNGIGIHIMDANGIKNNISQNLVQDNSYGMLVEGFYNNILNNKITGNTIGLDLYSGINSVINNTIKNNTNEGIIIRSSHNIVRDNAVSFNQHGVSIFQLNNSISNNIIENNAEMGINLVDAQQSVISNNSVRDNNNNGIYMDYRYSTDFNKILGNTILNNLNDGIHIILGDNNIVSGNLIKGHDSDGFYIAGSDDNIISENVIENNTDGLHIQQCDYNIVENNNIKKNRDIGIYLHSDNWYNNFTNNNISLNINHGVYLNEQLFPHILNYYNLFSGNNFSANLINAFDVGNYNYWNSSTIGNYWDDNLPNRDINDDGVGEITYNVTETPYLNQDFLPIFYDWDDPAPPIITIISPEMDKVNGIMSPDFRISIQGLHIDTKWYELIGASKNFTFIGNMGQIEQSIWDEFGNGTVTLRFYVNDTLGYGTMDEIIVRKDVYEPELIINSPINNNLYDNVAPTFNVEISDPNLDTSWYSLNSGLTNIIFTTNSSINQTVWDSTPDGQVIINFYANDTISNLVYDTVMIRKDTTYPLIAINSPTLLELAGKNTISFNVNIYDLTLDTMWYTIEGALTNITFTSNGTIDQVLWSGFGSGNLNLIFFANDSTGLLSSDNIIITKDIDNPIISINDPTPGETFYANPPNFVIVVNDPHLDSVWYTIDGGITNTTIASYTDVIAQNLWAAAAIGEITIRFYAIDTVGNINYREVTVSKESVSAPPSGPGVPGYDLSLFVSVIMIISVIKVFKNKKKK